MTFVTPTTPAILPFQASVVFGGPTGPLIGPETVTIIQKEFNHELAILRFWADDVERYISGLPVLVQYGRGGILRNFCGYVHEAERHSTHLSKGSGLMSRNSTEVRCVGASYWMKLRDGITWTNRTAPQIVTAIAQKFGLGCLADNHNVVWPAISMGGMSYWQFCVQLAKRIGFTFFCDGAQLVFIKRAIDPVKPRRPVFTFDYSDPTLDLATFDVRLGANACGSGALRNRQAATINPRTGSITQLEVEGNPSPRIMGSLQEQPLFNEIEQFPSDSMEELTARLGGVTLDQQFYIPASAELRGNPLIDRGCLLYVKNANGSQDGVWYTREAAHHINPKTYTTKVEIGRESLGGTSYVGPVIQTSSPARTRFSGGRWLGF